MHEFQSRTHRYILRHIHDGCEGRKTLREDTDRQSIATYDIQGTCETNQKSKLKQVMSS